MYITLLVLACLVWTWTGFKTWAFVVEDLSDHDGKASVFLGSFAGLVWPLTFITLTLVLLAGVLVGNSIRSSCKQLKTQWKK